MADIDLSIRHPDYDRMLARWVLAFDFFRGGIHVLQPAQYVQTVSWQTLRRDDASATAASPGRSESVFEWFAAPRNSYLHKHRRERLEDWEQRCARAYHYPLFRPTCNVFASAVLKTGPKRTVTGASWDAFFDNVDLLGSSMNQHARETLTQSIVLGRMHGIVDMPSSDAPVSTLREQLERGLRPYVRPVSPFDIVNWSVDEYGAFRWVQIREDMPDTRAPGLKADLPSDRYRIWYPDHWELWEPAVSPRSRRMRWNLVAAAEHPCGRVPLATLQAQRGERTMLGVESPLADVADVDRSIFNDWSLLDELLCKQTFSILAFPRREGAPMPDVEVGPGMGVVYDAEGSPPSYLSPEAAQILAVLQIIQQKLELARAAAEVGRGSAEQSKEARSSAAISAEQGDRNNMMASLAESVESYEREVCELASAWSGETSLPEISYSRRFDLRAINSQIADIVQLATLQVSGKVLGALSKPVVLKMLQEAGADEDEISAVLDAIDDEPPSGPQPPEPPGAGDEPTPSADEQAMRRADA